MTTTAKKKVIKVRRANNAPPKSMEHFTLTRVENRPDKCFAFGISDDGTREVYVPAAIVKAEQMTSADIGAGFKCLVKEQTGHETNAHPLAVHPIKWDGEAETIEVEEDDEPEVSSSEFEELQSAFDELTTLCDSLVDNTLGLSNKLVGDFEAMLQAQGRLFATVKDMRTQIHNFSKRLDEVAPADDSRRAG